MTVRNRLVNFRVTEEELRHLQAASALHNARCLSDFARAVILDSASTVTLHSKSTDAASEQLPSFEHRLSQIESAVGRIMNALEKTEIFTKAER